MPMTEWLVSRRMALLGSIALAGFAVIFYPFQSTVTNAWTIAAVNADGHPIAGCRIEQKWEWRAVGLSASAVATTDVAGRAFFPARRARASIFERSTGSIVHFNFHGPGTARSVKFFGCDEKNRQVQLGVYQFGDSLSYEHRVSTAWRDSSMLK